MSVIIQEFPENPYTRMLRELYPHGFAESAKAGENPYPQMLRKVCSIPNPYRPDPACRSVQAPKDEFIPNPYRSEAKNIAPQRSKVRRSNVFHIPNPYR